MNLNRFIDKYGGFSFDEVPFTEIDNVIFSSLSYLNLDGFVSTNHHNKRTLQKVAGDFFNHYSKKNKDIYAIKKAIKVFKNIQDTKRYKDLLLYNYVYESGAEEQFSALTIEIQNRLVYVSFEGTDQLLSGWKEDFMFSYMFPTISQKRAIEYINKHFWLNRTKIILGGHSKGGNLALVAGMYANIFVKNKIIKIYNNDGPGLLSEQIESDRYCRIKKKLVHLVPEYSIVGVLLRHDGDYVVIRSMKKGIFAHDFMSWVVNDLEFDRRELSSFSKMLEEKLFIWLNQYDQKQRKRFVVSLFSIFEQVGIKSIIDIFEHKKLIFDLVLKTKDIDKETRKMLKECLLIFFQVSKDVKIEEWKLLFHKESKVQ